MNDMNNKHHLLSALGCAGVSACVAAAVSALLNIGSERRSTKDTDTRLHCWYDYARDIFNSTHKDIERLDSEVKQLRLEMDYHTVSELMAEDDAPNDDRANTRIDDDYLNNDYYD